MNILQAQLKAQQEKKSYALVTIYGRNADGSLRRHGATNEGKMKET